MYCKTCSSQGTLYGFRHSCVWRDSCKWEPVGVVTSPCVGWLRSRVWFLGGVKSCTVLQIVHTGSGGPLIPLFCGFQCLFPGDKASGVWTWPRVFCTHFNACYCTSLYSKYFVAVRLSNVAPAAAAPLTLVRLERWIHRKPLFFVKYVQYS
jgi:hypothetical protein